MPPVPEALGQSEAFLTFQERLSRAAAVDRPVLLVGERGTGKELAAYRLHYLSPRWQAPFITLNCAALAPTLIESELFGHEAGAFTGATGRRKGRFEAAQGGTLFLDEVGAIPLEAQEKILRVVEYGVFERVGGSNPIAVDVRIVGATNADLSALAQEGRFKADLLDRLSFEVLFLPPLRERGEDVLFLARHFAVRMAHELGWTEIPDFSEAAETALTAYPWPGNVRELKNTVERAVYRSEDAQIDSICFDPFSSPFDTPPPPPLEKAAPPAARSVPIQSFKEAVRDCQIALIKTALGRCGGNQRRAAAALDLSYDQFRGYYRKYRERIDDPSGDIPARSAPMP